MPSDYFSACLSTTTGENKEKYQALIRTYVSSCGELEENGRTAKVIGVTGSIGWYLMVLTLEQDCLCY